MNLVDLRPKIECLHSGHDDAPEAFDVKFIMTKYKLINN